MRYSTQFHCSSARPRGTALVAAFLAMALMVGLSAALMQTAVSHTAIADSTRDSQQALMLAQAGLSAAINDVNRGASGNISRTWGVQQSFETSTTNNGDATYTVTSVGTVENSASLGNGGTTKRKIQGLISAASSRGTFIAGAFGKSSLTLTGVAHTDSYDSGLGTTYAQQVAAAGGYANYLATVGSAGHVGSNGSVSGSGNIVVHGNATPGPSSTVSLSGGASVTGSTAPAPGSYDVGSYTYAPAIAAGGAFSVSGSATQSLSAGTYRYTSWSQSGSAIVNISGIVNLYIDGNFSQSGQSVLNLASGAQVNLFQGKTGSFSLSGQGVQNVDQNPNDFSVVSASTSSVSITGQGNIFATVYAPDANVTISGQGELFGAAIGKNVSLSGLGTVHFDKSATSPGIHQTVTQMAFWEVDM